jgi:hypothetical protein
MIDLRGLTYGAEFEFADIRRNHPLPKGFKWDDRDCTIVNSTGIANDPKGKFYDFGGEINTPPTGTIAAQVDHLSLIKERYPEARINYRSNTHTHIRIPGLRDNLDALKRFALYNDYWLRKVLPIIEPIPQPQHTDYPRFEDFRGATRRYKRRKRSHQTILPHYRTNMQLEAATVEQFFAAEVPWAGDGTVMWHAQPRAAVNLRQLRETDTVEFRHWPGTLDEEELRHCLDWMLHYVQCVFGGWAFPAELDPYRTFKPGLGFVKVLAGFPKFALYDHGLEVRYRATCHDGSLNKNTIVKNIYEIHKGVFDAAAFEASVKW